MSSPVFLAYNVSFPEFDPDSTADLETLADTMRGAPSFDYVELTSDGVVFQDDYRLGVRRYRLEIVPQDGTEFNTADVLSILNQSRSFYHDFGYVKGMVTGRLDRGIVLAHEGGEIRKAGTTFAALSGELAAPR